MKNLAATFFNIHFVFIRSVRTYCGRQEQLSFNEISQRILASTGEICLGIQKRNLSYLKLNPPDKHIRRQWPLHLNIVVLAGGQKTFTRNENRLLNNFLCLFKPKRQHQPSAAETFITEITKGQIIEDNQSLHATPVSNFQPRTATGVHTIPRVNNYSSMSTLGANYSGDTTKVVNMLENITQRVEAIGRRDDADDPIEKITRLKSLLDAGALTAEEFALKKAELLARV